MTETQGKILDTAERLFGDQGYAGTSLRQIIAEAGVNLAAIHYHFGSKEELLDHLLMRKVGPVNTQRLALLDRFEAEAGSAPVPVEKLLRAFLEVPLAGIKEHPDFAKLMGRLYGEGMMPKLAEKHFQPLLARFVAAFSRALPRLSQSELMLRLQFVVGGMAHTILFVCQTHLPGQQFPVDGAVLLRELTAFAAAGLQAPAAEREKERGKFMRITYLLLIAAQVATGAEPLRLSLKKAVEVAISPEGSARVQLADEALKQAQARSLEQRAALLPNVDGTFSDQSRTENLAALGFNPKIFGAIPIPGFSFSTFVGPFTTVDARISGSQSVFDFSTIRRYQASKVGVTAARSDTEATQEQVASQVARAYLAAVKADADVETAQANVTLSEALLKQAENEKEAGTGTGIEITRARVQLANDRQRLLVVLNARHSTHLQLLRAMNMRLDTDLELTDKLQYVPLDAQTLDAAKAQALKERPDLKAQQQREQTARISASATKLERYPSVSAFGDYGDIGTSLTNSVPTRTVGLQVRVPIFNGGRREAEREESASQYRAETVRTSDLKEQIELDVRLALDSLQSADQQVKVAQEGLDLANNELTQARRRYDAGVAVGVEVTDAQTRLERARDNQTAALYNFNLSRLDLEQAMGRVRNALQ